MKLKNQTSYAFERIIASVKRHPLAVPVLIVVITVYLVTYLVPVTVKGGRIESEGVIRSVELKLDGSMQAVIKTSDFGRILYNGDPEAGLIPGDTVFISGYVKVFDKPSNPGQFDYADHLRRRGISGVFYPDEIMKIKDGPVIMQLEDRLSRFFHEIRKYVVSLFDDEEDKALAGALFMGDDSLISDEVSRQFRLSGCSHLLAVSGTHFAAFLMILSEFLRKSHISRGKGAPAYILFCVLVGTLTGWSESVTRACFMSIGNYLSRDWISGMALAAAVLMADDPYSVLSAGFQMSFAAAAAIRLFGGRLEELLKRVDMPQTMISALVPVISAMIGMMPFRGRTCCYISFVHLAVQITASFIASAACVFFIPTVLTGIPFACSVLFKLLTGITSLCPALSFHSLSTNGLSESFIYSAFAVLCVFLLPPGTARRFLIRACLALLGIATGFMVFSAVNSPDVTIVFLDVGQGDSCLIMTEGRSVLIDGGIPSSGQYIIGPALDYYGIEKVDMAIATHLDEDHAGGLQYLYDQGRIDVLLDCFDINAGWQMNITDELELNCIWPLKAVDGSNEDSVVLRLVYGDLSVLFTGDIGIETELALISRGEYIDSDILKVAHHGSSYSTSTEFIECVSPEIAVISVGAGNMYGHPAPDTLRRLEEYGCLIKRTDCSGALILETGRSGTILRWPFRDQ